jgi:tRNA dimethylallyltransferase
MQQASRNKVIIIAGPTAVGKTGIAMQLAKQLGTSIISADSRQCYKEMTIGTAKPTNAERKAVKHYFIDEYPVTTSLTAADFEQLAIGYLEEIFQTNNTAIVCGGTGLYIDALCKGIDYMPKVDDIIEGEIHAEYEERGLEWLQEEVKKEDPDFYAVGEVQNPVRLLRALIFKLSTGESIMKYRTGTLKKRQFQIIKIALDLPREILYERVNKRVDEMMQHGLLEEVKTLYPHRHLKNLQTVGYSELFDHLEGNCTLEEATDKIKQHTRNYAKRQLTWFRKDKEMHWLHSDDKNVVDKIRTLSLSES